MAEAFINVTEGSGKKLHHNSRTIGADLQHDEYTLQGEPFLAAYTILADAVSIATAASHTITINAGASLPVRIRRIRFRQVASATAAAVGLMDLFRTTTAAPTGGTAITPRPVDSADAAAGCTAMTLPTVKATEGVLIYSWRVMFRQAFLTTASQADEIVEWVPAPNSKSIIIPAGTTNGIALKSTGGIAAATISIAIDVVETNFV